jgi:hypothetical protein
MSLRDVSAESIEHRLHELRALGDGYAAAYAEAAHLEEFRKSKKAILMKEAERLGHKSVASQEVQAYAHKEYLELLDALKVATEQREKLRWQFEIARLTVGVWQTQRADGRAERKAYGA